MTTFNYDITVARIVNDVRLDEQVIVSLEKIPRVIFEKRKPELEKIVCNHLFEHNSDENRAIIKQECLDAIKNDLRKFKLETLNEIARNRNINKLIL
jgi:hypothetical protein